MDLKKKTMDAFAREREQYRIKQQEWNRARVMDNISSRTEISRTEIGDALTIELQRLTHERVLDRLDARKVVAAIGSRVNVTPVDVQEDIERDIPRSTKSFQHILRSNVVRERLDNALVMHEIDGATMPDTSAEANGMAEIIDAKRDAATTNKNDAQEAGNSYYKYTDPENDLSTFDTIAQASNGEYLLGYFRSNDVEVQYREAGSKNRVIGIPSGDANAPKAATPPRDRQHSSKIRSKRMRVARADRAA